MLSVQNLTRTDLGKAASYYGDGADDYYAKEGDAAVWQGKGADMLGLEGPVDREKFKDLLAGKLGDGQRVSRSMRREDTKERIGIDLTFSAPKSVSIQALIGRDPEIIKAHDRAVEAAVAAAEQRALARQKINGKTVIERTGNLVVAKFRHETSRELDPQLHTHAVVMNLTRRADGEWRALKNDDIVKQVMYFGAVYQSELAAELQRLGYQIRQEHNGTWELAHISREQLAEFSRRSQQIEERLAAKGITREEATAAEKQAATMQTRAKKSASVDRDAIYQDWVDRAKSLQIDFDRREWHSEFDRERENTGPGKKPSTDTRPGQRPERADPERGPGREARREPSDERAHVEPGKPRREPRHGPRAPSQGEFKPVEEAARLAVRYAINHLTERQSVMNENELVRVAMTQALGAARMTDIEKEIRALTQQGFLLREAPLFKPIDQPGKGETYTRTGWIEKLVSGGMPRDAATRRVDEGLQSGRLKSVESRFTTQTALKREKAILAIERDGRGKVAAVMSKEAFLATLEAPAKGRASKVLNEGQRGAAEMILTTTNRIVGVQGWAGVGKSQMLGETIKHLESQGFEARVLAPYGAQVKDLKANKLTANTLASFLKGKRHIDSLHDKSIVVLDEAGIVPARLMERLLKVIEQKGARLVLLGDTEQTKAIEAGRPFAQLQAAGMELRRIEEIQRQKDPTLKRAVELAAQGKSAESLGKVQDIRQIEDATPRRQAIVSSFMDLTPEDRSKTLIITGTNDARREINTGLREVLGTAGKGEHAEALLRRDSTQAERRFSRNYVKGDVIQPEKNYANGMKRGESYRVVDTGPGNQLTVVNANDAAQRISFCPLTHTKLSVYKPERLEFSVGDQVRMTRNDAALDVANGDRFNILAIDKTKMVLEASGRRIELPMNKPLHIDYAYVSTVHGSQGLTCDRVLYEADSKSRTTAKDVYYVAISRAREQAVIFTNDKSALPAAIGRDNVKHAALDIAREKQRGKTQPQAQKAKQQRANGEKSRAVQREQQGLER